MKRIIVGVLALALVIGCGGGDSDGGGEGTPAVSAAPLGTGSISGTIAFTGTAPSNPPIDMSEEAQCAEKYTDGPVDPIVVVNDGNLQNVFVSVTSGLPADAEFPMSATTPSIDQNGCLYAPRVLGVMVGQDFEIRNSDPLSHNIKAQPTTNRPFNISQPREGMTSTRSFRLPEMAIRFECNVHGWMNAYISVLEHPYFATSGGDGAFTISGLPAGTYEIEAWHESLGTQTMTVTIGDGEAGTADFTFSAS